MDKTFQKKSKKWIIYVSIIVLLALLLAFGPIFFANYMRNKEMDMAQKLNTIKSRLKVKGVLKVSDEDLYLLGNNSNIYLIVGGYVDELKQHLDEEVTIMGPVLPPEDIKIDGKEIRFVIAVDKYGFPDLDIDNLSDEQKNILKDKINRRTEFVDDINAKLKKRVRYDAIKGKIELETKIIDGVETAYCIIKDEFGDVYVLLGEGDNEKEISKMFDTIGSNIDNTVVCLGKTAIHGNIPLVKDEVVFEVFEIYDENLNKIN